MKLLRTGGQVLAARAAQVVAGAAVGLLVARMLGPAAQGRYSLTVAVMTFAGALLNGGVGLSAVPLLRRRELPLRRVLAAQGVWLALAGGALLAAGAVATTGAAAAWTDAHLGWTGAVAAAAAVGAAGLLACDVLFYDVLAQGRPVAGAAAGLARPGSHLLLLLACLALTGGLRPGAAVALFAAAQIVGAVVLFGLLRRAEPVPAADAGRPRGAPALAGALARAGWLGQLSAVASLLHMRLNFALLAAWHGAAAVGVFSVAVLVGELLWNLPSALSPILVFSSAAPGDAGARDRLAARAVRVGLVATAAVALPLGLAAGWLLPRLFGSAYAAAAPALRALLPGIVAFAPGAVLAGDFIGRGRPGWNAQASAFTLAVNLVAGLALVPRFGLPGAAWASTTAYIAGATWMVLRFRRASGLTWRALLGRA
ncbi:MAG: lipopolysaccharide biosynthesis protein [Candidatus Krumholzibacteriia bacterium]